MKLLILLEALNALNETQSGVTINYNGQPKLAVKPDRAVKDTLMMLPVAAMDAAFGKDGEGFYVGPGGSGAAIGKRYAGFQDWISKHDTYELPEVYVNENGKLSFTNGRHRYAVLRDAGVDPMPVAMARSGVPNAQRFLRGVIREDVRLDRAKAQGFDTDTVWYHGTRGDVRELDPSKGQRKTTGSSAVFLTPNPKFAIHSANYNWQWKDHQKEENVMPLYVRNGLNLFDYENPEHIELFRNGMSRALGHIAYDERVTFTTGKNRSQNTTIDMFIISIEQGDWTIIESDFVQDILRELGFDGFRVEEHGLNNIGVFDPNNIRSVFDLYEGMLNEMADPAMIKDAAPKVLARLKKQMVGDSKSSESRVRVDFQKETGLETGDPKWDEAFAIWKEGYAQRIVGKAIGQLNNGMEFRGGKLLAYRMIEAGSAFLDDEWGGTFSTRGLGQYWTWDKEAAYAWRGEGGDSWLITGAVDPAHVNWEEILYANAHPALSHEKEINIPEGTPVKILNIEMNGESVDPSLYGGRGRTLMASLGESDDGRLARAEAMGFDTSTVFYHGTNSDIEEFSRGERDGRAGKGIYFAMKHFVPNTAAKHRTNTKGGNATVYPVYLKADNQYVTNTHGDDLIIGLNAEALEARGYTGVDVLNLDGELIDRTIFDPSNIRSVHAQFNDANSSNILASIGEGVSVQMSSDEMIQYLRQHHDVNLHQDYIDHIQSFDSFVLRDIPIASIAKTELAGLEQAKVAQYKGMDFSNSPPIVMGGGHILDGYHRVSVAKALGIQSIKGYVGMES